MLEFKYLVSGMFVLISLLKLIFYYVPVLRIRIRDPAPCPFDPWDPGWEKNQDPDPG